MRSDVAARIVKIVFRILHVAIAIPSLALTLAARAVETRALTERCVANRRGAPIAGFSLATIDHQAAGESSRLSARIQVAAKGGAAAADRIAQHVPRCRYNLIQLRM